MKIASASNQTDAYTSERITKANWKYAGVVACPAGIEPATPSLEGSCSIQLSYGQPYLCLHQKR